MVQTTERQFIPNPEKWFNQDRFLDDRSDWNQVRSNGNGRQEYKKAGSAEEFEVDPLFNSIRMEA
jgi:hypothetical protein